jgi:hypothetical protein
VLIALVAGEWPCCGRNGGFVALVAPFVLVQMREAPEGNLKS